MNSLELKDIIKRALHEDIGFGDITTSLLVPDNQMATGAFYAKSDGVAAGLQVCREVFSYLDDSIEFNAVKMDGQDLAKGDVIAIVKGKTANLLTGERVALNFMQRLSGIATKTRLLVDSIKYFKAELVDTRKTTPGLRMLEKQAVILGGARNHRFGLYDGILIKDNHLKVTGSIQKAVSTIRQGAPHNLKIEVEVENLEQLQEALEAQADIILLDNMDIENTRKAVELTAGQALLESSGGITEDNIVDVARTGVDYISVGALTHSIKSLDISFEIIDAYSSTTHERVLGS